MSSLRRKEQVDDGMVQVAVRCRPMNERELSQADINVVNICPSNNLVQIYDPKNDKLDSCKVFTFDAAYDCNSSHKEIYDRMVCPLVNSVLSGFNCTVFAYGQSGTGKTYTMEGSISNTNSKGIISRTFEQIFDHISLSHNVQYLVRVSYLEIYQDVIRDLLSKNVNTKYELRENKEFGVYVENITSFVCKSVHQIEMIMCKGRQNRTTGKTGINERSSRSHAIVTITVEMKDSEGPMENQVRVGKLNLVDLAGSERQNKTNAEDNRLKEACKINLSLTALGNVISVLAENKDQYIPYRDCKLTRLLSDSLGGNSKTLMIANIGPANSSYEESLNTLRYASRARRIKNYPQVNEDPIDALLRRYQEEIERLKCQLAERSALKYDSPNSVKTSRLVAEPDGLNKRIDPANSAVSTESIDQNTYENDKCFSKKDGDSEREAVHDLVRRIQSMESKLLSGTEGIIYQTTEQQKTLDIHINKIKNIRQREEEMQHLIDQHDGSMGGMLEEYSTLHQEIEIKSQKLLKMFNKLKSTQRHILDRKEEFNADRRELESIEHELLKELKLRLFIVKNFIPNERRRIIISRMHFDEVSDSWNLAQGVGPAELFPRPQCTDHSRRPVTLYSVVTQRKINHLFRSIPTKERREKTFRFKVENILELDLISNLRTTKDYDPPKISSVLNSVFKSALQVEEDINIDASHLNRRLSRLRYEKNHNPKALNLEHPTQALNLQLLNASKHSVDPPPVYPKARGLVPK